MSYDCGFHAITNALRFLCEDKTVTITRLEELRHAGKLDAAQHYIQKAASKEVKDATASANALGEPLVGRMLSLQILWW